MIGIKKSARSDNGAGEINSGKHTFSMDYKNRLMSTVPHLQGSTSYVLLQEHIKDILIARRSRYHYMPPETINHSIDRSKLRDRRGAKKCFQDLGRA
jgi:hypothetical protein